MTYRDIEIKLDRDNRFAFTLDGKANIFSSYSAATRVIDARLKQKAREATVKLSIPAITEDLRETTVTGMDARNGQLLTKPVVKSKYGHGTADLYFHTLETIALLSERKRLYEAINKIEGQLWERRVTWRKDSDDWGTYDPTLYGEYVKVISDRAKRFLGVVPE